MSEHLHNVAKRFARETRHHKMAVLHDDGLYRHLRCHTRHGLYWFDIVTWPGSLAIRGDLNAAYVFSRTSDMFGFFRMRSHGSINPGYWAEKLPEGRRSVQTYSEDLLRQQIRDALKDEYEDFLHDRLTERAKEFGLTDIEHMWPELARPCHKQTRDHMRKLRAAVHEHLFDDWQGCGIHDEETALRGLDDFSFVSDEGHKFQFMDWQEWGIRDWDWSFLWACHAIMWAINRYDALKVAGQLEEPPTWRDVLRAAVVREGGDWTTRRAVDVLAGQVTAGRARVLLNKLADEGLLVKHGKLGRLWTPAVREAVASRG